MRGYKVHIIPQMIITILSIVQRDIATTSDPLIYPYTRENINEFFSSQSWTKRILSLEESVCTASDRKSKIINPSFIIVRQSRTVENIHLKSIENHIRLKDPERHKAKLLELLSKGKEKEGNEQMLEDQQ